MLEARASYQTPERRPVRMNAAPNRDSPRSPPPRGPQRDPRRGRGRGGRNQQQLVVRRLQRNETEDVQILSARSFTYQDDVDMN